ncbi:hypothetical protein ACTMU2_18675 [Cupriavidus basilensis]
MSIAGLSLVMSPRASSAVRVEAVWKRASALPRRPCTRSMMPSRQSAMLRMNTERSSAPRWIARDSTLRASS